VEVPPQPWADKYSPTHDQLDPLLINRTAEILLQAARPTIIAGGGVHWAHCAEEVRELAELLSAPFGTSPSHKGVLSEFAFLEGTKPTHAIILCEGFPAIPKRQEVLEYLANQGFLVFQPRYRGTWESDGEFLAQSPIVDIRDVVEVIKSNSIQELFSMKTFTFDIQRISVIGTSFGGSVALSSILIPEVQKVVALSPVVNFKTFNTTYKEQDLKQIGEFMLRAFANGYRFTRENWTRLLSGEIIPPIEIETDESREKIFIIQCEDDQTVNHRPVTDFAQKLKVKYELLSTGGHFSFSKISRELWQEIFEWIEK